VTTYANNADAAIEVEDLIKGGANINVKDAEGNTPLIWAVIHKNSDVVKLLVKAGADITIKNNVGKDARDLAGNNLHISNILSNADLVIHKPTKNKKRTPIDKLCDILSKPHNEKIEIEAIELILAYPSMNLNEPSRGRIALILAADHRYWTVLRQLITKGADVNAKDDGGYTALMFAVANGDLPMIELLLKAGADATIWDHDHKTAVGFINQKSPKKIREKIEDLLSSKK